LLLWLFTAYLVLPRVHRILSKFYVPNYFIGRVRTADGLLGDPVNLAVIGSPENLKKVMTQAGWSEAEPLSLMSRVKMVWASVLKRSYPAAPVSSLFLFYKKQDYAFQKEVNGNPRKRHHVRFWHVPKGWRLPGGRKVDFVGAATFDRRVGLSLFTLQVTHKIAENTDEERDLVAKSLGKQKGVDVEVVKYFTTAYHHRSGGGDQIKTDGALPFIDVSKLVTETG